MDHRGPQRRPCATHAPSYTSRLIGRFFQMAWK